jgi:endoribonuclease Dicer
MVTNTALATICVETELYKYIIHDSPTLQTSIDEYVRELKKSRNVEYQLAESEGRMPGQYWVDVEPPKVVHFTTINGFSTDICVPRY